MRTAITAITAITLTCGLWPGAAAPGLAATPARYTGGAHFAMADGSVHFGLHAGTLVVVLETRPDGSLLGTVEQDGRPVHRYRPFAIVDRTRASGGGSGDCLSGWPDTWKGGRAEVVESRDGSGELRAHHPRTAGCVLVGELPAPGSGPGLATPGADPVPGGRPNPGGPIQDTLAAALADLRIRTADPVAGDPVGLAVDVRNVGPGPAAATALKLYFHTAAGQVLTATAPVPALAPGQQAWVKIAAPKPLAAAKKVNLRVDDPNQVAETDELNNGYMYK
jgi:prepilin-type processing-associated H-X9-DG protein